MNDFWFSFDVSEDQCVTGFRSLNSRVSEEEIRTVYKKFAMEEKNYITNKNDVVGNFDLDTMLNIESKGERSIYLLAILITKLYTKEEMLEILQNLL